MSSPASAASEWTRVVDKVAPMIDGNGISNYDQLPSLTAASSVTSHLAPSTESGGTFPPKDAGKSPSLHTRNGDSNQSAHQEALHIEVSQHGMGGTASKTSDEDAERSAGPRESKAAAVRKVTISDFVRFATPTNTAFNLVGIVAACAAGAAQPLMTIVSLP